MPNSVSKTLGQIAILDVETGGGTGTTGSGINGSYRAEWTTPRRVRLRGFLVTVTPAATPAPLASRDGVSVFAAYTGTVGDGAWAPRTLSQSIRGKETFAHSWLCMADRGAPPHFIQCDRIIEQGEKFTTDVSTGEDTAGAFFSVFVTIIPVYEYAADNTDAAMTQGYRTR